MRTADVDCLVPSIAPSLHGTAPHAQRSVALLYALTIAGYPLVSAIPTVLGTNSRGASVLFRAAMIFLAFYVIALKVRRRETYRGAAWLPLLAFWMLYATRIAADVVFRPIDLKLHGYEYIMWAIGTCFIPMLAFMTHSGTETLRLAARYTFWCCVLALMGALYVTYVELSLGISDAYGSGRLGSETLNPISLGNLGVSLTLLSIYYFPRRGWLARAGLAGLVIAGLFTAFASGSRGPIAALGVCLLLQAWVWSRRRPATELMIGLLVMACVSAALIIGAFQVEDRFGFRIVSRFTSGSSFSAGSSEGHITYLADARDEFVQHPIFGSALDEIRSHDYPHNVLVESFMATGVVGGFMFGAFLLWSLLRGISLAIGTNTRWLAFLLVQQVVVGLTAGALYLSGSMWSMSAAGIATFAFLRSTSSGVESGAA